MLSEVSLNTFNCISGFLEDLSSLLIFEKVKSISLFNKLIMGTTFRDEPAIVRYIDAFKNFYLANPKFITERMLTGSAKIIYNDRIYIDMDYVMKKTGSTDSDTIYKHLVAIYTVMNIGKKESLQALEILKTTEDVENNTSTGSINTNSLGEGLNLPDTVEGEFIKDSLQGIGDLANEINLDENANPAEIVGAVMQSEFFKNFSGGLQSKFEKGEIDVQSLLKTVGGIVTDSGMGDEMGSMLSGLTGMPGAENIGDMLSSLNIGGENSNDNLN